MQTHDFTATMQFGIVSAIDESSHSLRVKIPVLDDMVTDWLPMATPAAGGNRFYSLPDEGELVVCLLDVRGETGCVIGAIYNAADKPPVSPCFPSIPAMLSCSQEEQHCFSYGRNLPKQRYSTTSTDNSLTFTA